MTRLSSIQPGDRHGRLTVIGRIGKTQQIECVCECGKTTQVNYSKMLNGVTKSCGCLAVEAVKKANTTHGYTKHPLYRIWAGMKCRCYKPDHDAYPHYGGRGIQVCAQWRNDAKAFIDWMLENGWEQGLQIDRIDVNGDYSPSNCRVVSGTENCRNKRNNRRATIFGENKTLVEWAEDPRCVVNANALSGRLKMGWDAELAASIPAGATLGQAHIKYLYTAFGETKSPGTWTKDPRCLVSFATLVYRVESAGWNAETAMTTPTLPPKLFAAFGEEKTADSWAKDPRCVVDKHALRYRLESESWDNEKALTTPVRPSRAKRA